MPIPHVLGVGILLVLAERERQDRNHQSPLRLQRIGPWPNELRREKLVLYDYNAGLHLAPNRWRPHPAADARPDRAAFIPAPPPRPAPRPGRSRPPGRRPRPPPPRRGRPPPRAPLPR